MKNRKLSLKKRVWFALSGVLAAGVLVSAIVPSVNQSSSISSVSTSNDDLTPVSNSKNADLSSTTSYVVPTDLGSSNQYDFSNTPLQNIVYDDNNTGVAMLTSSTSADVGDVITYDQIKMFNTTTSSTTDSNGTTTPSYAGTAAWVVDRSDFVTAASSGNSGVTTAITDATAVTIKGIMYSAGGYGEYESVFVLTNVGTNTYVFRIQWSNQTINSTTVNGGIVSLFKEIDGTAYDVMVLESPSTHTMQLIDLPDDLSGSQDITTSSTITFNYLTISSSSTSTTSNTITADTTVAANYFDNGATYSLAYVERVSANLFFVFEKQTVGGNTGTNDVVFIKSPVIPSTQTNLTLSDSNLSSLSLTDSGFAGESRFKTHVLETSTGVYNVVFTESTNSSTSHLAYTSVNVSSFTVGTPTSYSDIETGGSTTTDASGTINTYSFINQIMPVYTVNTTTISYYVALTSNNTALRLDTSFSYVSELYDFNRSTISTIGSIYNIYTKSGDSSWYAQMTDGTFAQFNGDTLIGQWDQLVQTDSMELPVNANLLTEDQISSTVLYQSVTDNGTDANDSFTNYLNSSTAYQDFLDITFQDPRLNNAQPSISVSASSITQTSTDSRIYSVTLTFTQTLRTITSSGSISTTTTSTVQIAQQTYTFVNAGSQIIAPVNVTASNTSNSTNEFESGTYTIPSYIAAMNASEVAALINADTDAGNNGEDNYAVRNGLVQITNAAGAVFYASGDDTNGSLTLNITVPAFWIQSGSGTDANYTLSTNYSQTLTYQAGYFAFNEFGTADAISVTGKDQSYFDDTTNESDANSLRAKYGATLPSEVDAYQLYEDFFVLGSAFSNSDYVGNTITLPTADNIQVVPYDDTGSAYISVTFPRIGSQTNVRYSVTTPSIFATSSISNKSTYFIWKGDSEVVANTTYTADGAAWSTLSASDIASTLDSELDASNLDSVLSNFALFSSGFTDLLTSGSEITITANDYYGQLTVTLNPTSELSTLGSDSYWSMTFSGFTANTTDTTGQGTYTAFSFTTSNASSLLSSSPSSITAADLINAGVIPSDALTAYGYGTTDTNVYITLTPSNSTGSLLVEVTFKNWVESGGTSRVSSKTFSTTLTGFTVTGEATSMLVWKSTSELDSTLSARTPSAAQTYLTGLESASKLTVLQMLANVSDTLLSQISDDDITLYYTATNTTGTLSVTAIVNVNGVTKSFSTTFSGFRSSSSTTPSFVTVANTSAAVTTLANSKLPSEVTNEDVTSLYTISGDYEASTWSTSITLLPDDYTGTLTIQYQFINNISSDYNSDVTTVTYSGFLTNIPTDQGTNWLIVALCIVIPLIVFTIPILVFGYIQNRRDVKKIARRLDKRLTEQYKKRKRTGKSLFKL